MNILRWVPQILLTIAFLMSGFWKLLTPYEDLNAILPWTLDFSPTMIHTIALLEILGSLGLILPMILKRFTFLVPLSAIGLSLIMVGAIFTHANLGEPIWINLILLVLCSIVIYIRKDLFKVKSAN